MDNSHDFVKVEVTKTNTNLSHNFFQYFMEKHKSRLKSAAYNMCSSNEEVIDIIYNPIVRKNIFVKDLHFSFIFNRYNNIIVKLNDIEIAEYDVDDCKEIVNVLKDIVDNVEEVCKTVQNFISPNSINFINEDKI